MIPRVEVIKEQPLAQYERKSLETKNVPGHKTDLIDWLHTTERNELLLQAINRAEMLKDHRYYDGLQWDWNDAREIAARGQAPVSYNWLKPRIDWMTGTERRARVDFKVLPRRQGEEFAKDAQIKTDVLKYLSDVNNSPYHRSRVFKEALIGGISFIECGIRQDPEDEPAYLRQEHWWNILWDSCSTEYDTSDWRYCFRLRQMDADIAKAFFPGHELAIDRAATGTHNPRGNEYYLGMPLESYDITATPNQALPYLQFDASAWLRSTRDRVLARECYFFMPVKQTVRSPGGSIFDRVKMQLRMAIYVENHVIYEGLSPYRHNRIPFVPVWCYRRALDGSPYGMLRQHRDPQDSYNKRMSKALFAISSTRLMTEKSAIEPRIMSAERLRTEVSKPNAHLQFADGAISGGKVRLDEGRDLADSAVQFAEMDHRHIADAFGVNSENLGVKTNAVSGVAIERRQAEGGIQTTEPFDNLHFATTLAGQLELSNVEEYYRAPREFRLTTDRGGTRWAAINSMDPKTGEYRNDITREAADFVMDQQAWHATLAQAALEQLWGLLQQVASVDPQIVRAMLDLLIQFSNVPGKDLMVKRIREMTGMTDPDVPETPEERQRREAKVQADQQTQQVAMREAMLKLDRMEKDNKLLDAKAVRELMQAMYAAMQGAQVNAMQAGLAPVADEMLASAGFQDRGGDPGLVPPANLPYAPSLDSAAATAMPTAPAVPGQTGEVGAGDGIETPGADGGPTAAPPLPPQGA